MKKRVSASILIATLFALSVCAPAADKGYSGKAPGEKPALSNEGTMTAVATVKAIDMEQRLVTLEDDKGNRFNIPMEQQARNLPQLKIGDVLEATYYESVSIKVYKPGEVPSVSEDSSIVTSPKKGEKPGGLAVKQQTVTATVQSIDKSRMTAVLKAPDGKSMIVKVQDPKNLEGVNQGDEVVATFIRALAISVKEEKAK